LLRYFNISDRARIFVALFRCLAKFSMQMLRRRNSPQFLAMARPAATSLYRMRYPPICSLAGASAECAARVFNCATGRRITLNQTFQALKELTGYTGSVKYAPERSGDIKHSLADITLAQKHLGYKVLVNFEMDYGRRSPGQEPAQPVGA